MKKKEKILKDVLPYEGIWTVQDLADYLGLPANSVMEKLSNLEIPILSFSRMYRHKLFRLEDLRKKVLVGNDSP